MDALAALAVAGRPKDDDLSPLPDDVVNTLVTQTIEPPAADTGRPTTNRRWPRRVVRGGLAAAAAAGLVTAATLIGPTPTAEAQLWSAVPFPAEAAERADLEASCQVWLNSPAPAVITELRGSSSYTVLADSSNCLRTGDGAGGGGAGVLWQGTTPSDAVPMTATFPDQDSSPVQVAPNDLLTVPRVVTPAPAGGDVDLQAAGPVLTVTTNGGIVKQYLAINGRVGPEVRAVVVHRDDAADVTATVNDGWFAAWWPSSERPTSITVSTNGYSYDRQVYSD